MITVCGDAKENCPLFLSEVKQHLHIGFDDPAKAWGAEEEIYEIFRRVRDEIGEHMYAFYNKVKNP